MQVLMLYNENTKNTTLIQHPTILVIITFLLVAKEDNRDHYLLALQVNT